MAIIRKKLHPIYFEPVATGKKSFDFRIADFEIKDGDTLILEEWDPKTKKYTGRSIIKKVNYVKKFTLDGIEKEFGIARDTLDKNGFYVIDIN
jgi:ASC-1-like (ASCH) protein